MRNTAFAIIGLACLLPLECSPVQAQTVAAPTGTCEIRSGTGPVRCLAAREQSACIAMAKESAASFACIAMAKESAASYRWTQGQSCPAKDGTR